MIVDAYAVVYPGTVMVESFYAAVANCTVLASRCSKYLTLRTHFARVYLWQYLHELKLWFNKPWFLPTSDRERNRKSDWEQSDCKSEESSSLVYIEELFSVSFLLGVTTKSCVKYMTVNKLTNKICVLWLGFRGTIGVFIMKHSIYFGTLSICYSSFIIWSGRSSLIIWVDVTP